MLIPHENLIQQLERHDRDVKWIRISMAGAVVLILLYMPLLVMRMIDTQWSFEHLMYTFLVLIWGGILAIQYKILQRKEHRRRRLLVELGEIPP